MPPGNAGSGDDSVTVNTIEAITMSDGGEVAAQFVVSPQRPNALSTVRFDGSGSWCSSEDEIAGYRWDFGDHSVSRGDGPVVEHNFAQSGMFVVRLFVRTLADLQAEISKSVRVGFRFDLEHEPRCPITSNPVRITARAFVNLHAEDRIVEYAWDLNNTGQFDRISEDGELQHIFGMAGKYVVKVRATNVNGIVEEASDTIHVQNLTLAT